MFRMQREYPEGCNDLYKNYHHAFMQNMYKLVHMKYQLFRKKTLSETKRNQPEGVEKWPFR